MIVQPFYLFQDSTSLLFRFKNKAGDVVIKPQFSHALELQHCHLLFGVNDSGWIAINTKGEFLFKAYPFDNGPDYFSNGLIRVIQDNKIGYANKRGEIVIPPRYAYAESFNNGSAKVSQVERQANHDPQICSHDHNRYNVINKQGRIKWGMNETLNPFRETPKNSGTNRTNLMHSFFGF
jgi:hypothetical protein